MSKTSDFLRQKSRKIGGVILFNQSDAMEFVRLLSQSGANILGVDVFFFEGHLLRPSMRNSISEKNMKRINPLIVGDRAIMEHLAAAELKDAMFEFIYDEKPDGGSGSRALCYDPETEQGDEPN